MSNNPPRCVIVGLGGYAAVHARQMLAAQSAGRLVLVGAVEPARERASALLAELDEACCPVFSSAGKMFAALRPAPDLCVIATPIHIHRDLVIEALRAGANVLVEKPLAPTVADVAKIAEAERTAGRFAIVGFQHLYAQGTREVKRRLLGGEIGEVKRINAKGLWARGDSYYRRNHWAGRQYVDGALVLDSPASNALAHYLELALFLGGKTEGGTARPVAVTAETYRARQIESFDTVAMRVETEEGPEILFLATHACQRSEAPVLVVEGTRGRLEWTLSEHAEEGACRFVLDDGRVRSVPCESIAALRRGVIDGALDRLENRDAFVCDLVAAAAHVRCVDGIHRGREIETIAGAFLEPRGEDPGGEPAAIKGIEEVFDACSHTFRLPAELAVPWAVQGRRIEPMILTTESTEHAVAKER